jgi:hypothetical protein
LNFKSEIPNPNPAISTPGTFRSSQQFLPKANRSPCHSEQSRILSHLPRQIPLGARVPARARASSRNRILSKTSGRIRTGPQTGPAPTRNSRCTAISLAFIRYATALPSSFPSAFKLEFAFELKLACSFEIELEFTSQGLREFIFAFKFLSGLALNPVSAFEFAVALAFEL